MLLAIDLLLFISISFVHLYRRRYHGREIVGHITKMLLIPSLYLLIFLFAKEKNLTLVRPEIIFSIALCYTLGDFFLLLKKKSLLFYLGAIAFTIGHTLYIYYYSLFGFSWVAAICGAIFSLIFLVRYLKKIHSKVPGKELPYLLYGLGIVALSISIFASFKISNITSWIPAFFGCIFFGYSDSRIAYNKSGVKRSTTFEIMLTYIIANICLVLSILAMNMC